MTGKNIPLVLIAGALLAMSGSVFAERQAKTVICHVGNEYGLEGEVYLDDPGCVPLEENGYFCPDAGKIDLIEVANANKHLSNPNHSFESQSDYLPLDEGATGIGNEDTDGDGVDEGCETPVLLTCLCWNVFTEEQLVTALNAESWTNPICASGVWGGQAINDDQFVLPNFPWFEGTSYINNCVLNVTGHYVELSAAGSLSPEMGQICSLEAQLIVPQIDACQPN